MWLRSKFTTCSIPLPATMQTDHEDGACRVAPTLQSAPADWAKEATAKLVHRLTTGAAGDVIQMVFQNRLAHNTIFQIYTPYYFQCFKWKNHWHTNDDMILVLLVSI